MLRKLILSSMLIMMTFIFTLVNYEFKFTVADNVAKTMENNRAIISCGPFGGQGTITNVSSEGVTITTARHVLDTYEECNVMLADYSLHIARATKIFKQTDEAQMLIPNFSWPTQAHISSMKLGEELSAFGPIKPKEPMDLDNPWFTWDFSYEIHTGVAIMPVIGDLLKLYGYPAPSHNLVMTSVYSAPGSSGGGVYDNKGNLVGIVSGGSGLNHNQSILVNIQASLEEEGNGSH